MKVTGHEVTGVILAPVTSFTFFFNAWMVRYYRRRYRLRRRARPLRRFPMRRTRSRKYRKSRLPRQNRLITRTFKKVTVASEVITYATAQGEAASFAVRISDNADAAAMASNFDQYRINWAKWRFEPHSQRNSTYEDSSQYNAVNVATCGPPAIAAYIDRDDITTSLQSCNDALQRGGRMAFWPKPLTFKWRPRVTPMYYKDAVSTAYGPSSKPVWIDCNDQSVPHYGLKSYFAYPHSTSSSKTADVVYHYSLHVTFSVTFRDRLPFALVGNI